MSVIAPSHDILQIFPYEIWSQCILFAIDRAPEGPLPFLSVSSHWQRLLLDSPVMWSYIHVEDGEDTMARVHTFLHLSGRHPLEFAISFYGPIWRVVRPIVLLHSNRIYSVLVVESGPPNNKGKELLGTANWPALRIISGSRIGFSANIWEYLLTSCPNMQYYRCINFTDDDCRWLGEDTRETKANLFKITPRLSEYGQRFLRLPKLEKINLTIMSSGLGEQSQDTLHTFVLSSANLRYLGLRTHYSTVMEGIFSSPLGLLNTMVITIPPKLLHIIIKALPSLPLLYQWHLNLEYNEKSWNSLPIKREDVPRLRDFSLALHRPSKNTFKEIFRILSYDDALCQVKTARFSLVDHPTCPPELANIRMLLYLARNAHRLHFSDFVPVKSSSQEETPYGATISMQNLTELYIGYTALRLPLDTPRLLMLEISPIGSTENSPLELPEHFGQSVVKLNIRWEDFNKLKIQSQNSWSSVQNVQWFGFNPSAVSSTISFQSITSVEFKGNNYHKPDSAINLFLIALLRHPAACPNLRILKSKQYPAWELLFDTLNQRNQNKDVFRLEEIHLPALPVRPLLALVVSVLGGESGRFPLRGIDDTLSRRLQHQLITACNLCISSGFIYCILERRFPPLDTSDLWWQEKEDGSRHDRRNEQDYLELLDWDSQDLSANPDVRRGLSWKEWEEWLGETTAGWRELPKGVQREKQCLRHSSYTLTRINKYTLEGTEEYP